MNESRNMLIQNGKVYDHIARSFEKRDIFVHSGRIQKVSSRIDCTHESEIVDGQGKYVLPGLIDFHLHCFRYGQVLSVDVDELAPRSGTTAFVDVGSCGSANFLNFKEFVVKPSTVKIFSFLNISAIGMVGVGIKGIDFFENNEEGFLHIPSALETVENNRDTIIGIKVRMYSGLLSSVPLKKARELADMVHLPIMVHIASGSLTIEEILPFLKAGDIITHIFHGGPDNILDNNGKIRDLVLEARKRGIEFDVGLDRIHSDFIIIKAAMEQGFYPDYISTDLTVSNRTVTQDMPATMSKFLALGMPFEEVVYRSTSKPALKINKPDRVGCIEAGGAADFGIFELREGDFTFGDTYGNSVRATKRLFPVATIVDGKRLSEINRETIVPKFVID